MNFIENIFTFLKRIFNKKDTIKMLEAPVEKSPRQNKASFIDSLRINSIEKKKKKKVETLTCAGDGLGIQPKITY